MNAMSTNGKRGAKRRAGPRQSIAREVRQVLDARIEHKRNNNIVAVADWAALGVVLPISQAIAQGDDIYQRSGDTIRPKNLLIRFQATNSAGSVGRYLGRFIIFKDLACQGTAPAVTDVLQSADPLSGWAAINKQSHRFKILFDKQVAPVAQTNMSTIFLQQDFKLNGVVHYLATTGASSNGIGSIFALFVSSAVNAGVYTYSWSYDLEYTDA